MKRDVLTSMWQRDWKMVGRKDRIQETNLETLQWPYGFNLLNPLYRCCGRHCSILPRIPLMKDFWSQMLGILSADISCQPKQGWSQLQKAAWPKVMPSWASKGPPPIMTWCVSIKAWPSALNICLCLSTVLGPELYVESTEKIFGLESQFSFSPVQLCILLLFFRFDPKRTPFLKHHAQ